MSLADRAANIHKAASASKPRPPKDWEPGLTWMGERGVLNIDMGEDFRGESTDVWDDVIRQYTPMDPATVQVVEPVKYKQWTMPGSEVPHYWFQLVLVSRSSGDLVDVDALAEKIRKRGKRKAKKKPAGDHHLHVNLADWQAGKAACGGIEGLALRVEQLSELVPERIRQLRAIGKPIHTIHMNGLGDLFEMCRGSSAASQTFQTSANFRTQERFLRRAILELVDQWSAEAAELHVHAVGGNHGNMHARNDAGQVVTDLADNMDVGVFEQVADICAVNPDRYSNVAWQLPEEDLTITYAHGDFIVGLAHGHQASGRDMQKWWKEMIFGTHPLMHADLLVTAHYHHLRCVREGHRTWMQSTALEGDSASGYYREAKGVASPSGTLTFVTDGKRWSDMEILGWSS